MIWGGTKNGGSRLSLSAIVLIIANLVPLFGVIAWDWEVFPVVALYWLENVVIGITNILKMLTCSPDRDSVIGFLRKNRGQAAIDPSSAIAMNHGSKLFFVPFFTVHYGIFCFVHGFFVFILLGKGSALSVGGSPIAGVREMVGHLTGGQYFWAVAALVGSHFFSFIYNWFIRGEFRKTATPKLMISPYGRIVVLHLAILFGAFLTMALGNSVAVLGLLVVGKTVLDTIMHLRAHRKASA